MAVTARADEARDGAQRRGGIEDALAEDGVLVFEGVVP
jgi:hypothetical protein